MITCMILITLQSCQCFLRKHPYGVLIAYFSVKQMHMPEDRVAFIKEDISMGRIDAKSGEMMKPHGYMKNHQATTPSLSLCTECIRQYAVR